MPTYKELPQENSELRQRVTEQERRIEKQERRIAQLEKIIRAAARFPRQVKEILLAALALRDRREAQTISPQGVRTAMGRLAAQMDRLLSGNFTHEGNRRLAKHL